MIIIPRNYSTRLFPHETCPHKLKEEEEEQVQRIPQFQKIFLGQRGDRDIFEYARIGDTHVQQKQLCATAMMMCRDKCDFSFRVFNILSVMENLSAFSTINIRALRLGAIELKICIGTTEMR